MGKSVYLAGGMAKRRDGGVRWRKSITKTLKRNGYDEINDPTINEKQWFQIVTDHGFKTFAEMKAKDHAGYRLLMNVIRKHDEALIDASDEVIFYIDNAALQSDGTLLELDYTARLLKKGTKKEIYVVLRVPWMKLPSWSYATIQEYAAEHDRIFYNLTDLKAYIKENK